MPMAFAVVVVAIAVAVAVALESNTPLSASSCFSEVLLFAHHRITQGLDLARCLACAGQLELDVQRLGDASLDYRMPNRERCT